MKLKKYEGNPILRPNKKNSWEDLCVLNPGVIYDDKTEQFVMLYRAGGDEYEHYIRLGKAVSKDGFNFRRCSDKPAMDVYPDEPDGGCLEDARIVKIDDIYYITYAARTWYPGRYWIGPERYYKEYDQVEKSLMTPHYVHTNKTVTYLAMTRDFEHFKRLGRITDSRVDNRDVMIFPELIGGKYVRLSRPYEVELNGKKIPPSIFISYSDDLVEWGKEEFLMGGEEWWEAAKIGGSCPPIRTDRGWLFLYHGVATDPMAYRVGAVMLDLENPSKILARTKDFIMEADQPFEKEGFIGNVVFPCGNVVKDGVLYVYYGCADQYIGVATADLNELVDFIFKNTK